MGENVNCTELLADLKGKWAELWEGEQSYLMSRMVNADCQEVVPYLRHHLSSEDPFYREQALRALGKLKRRELRQLFIDFHLNDSDEEIRQEALLVLNDLFRGTRDIEILRLALTAFDNLNHSVGMRLAAGAVMMYQLDIPHDESGAPAWWNEEEEDLQHPTIYQAVTKTRRLLAQPAQPSSSQRRILRVPTLRPALVAV